LVAGALELLRLRLELARLRLEPLVELRIFGRERELPPPHHPRAPDGQHAEQVRDRVNAGFERVGWPRSKSSVLKWVPGIWREFGQSFVNTPSREAFRRARALAFAQQNCAPRPQAPLLDGPLAHP
jgi:hypothetical protein